jgi:hypothetical protein
MTQSEYSKALENRLLPHLQQRGFTQITLRDCMRPEVLYRRENLWLGTSWDWRDEILEASLGTLYWVKDVVPRVYVIGRYESYCPEFRSIKTNAPAFEEVVSEFFKATIEQAIVHRELHPELEIAECKSLGSLLLGVVSDAELLRYEA